MTTKPPEDEGLTRARALLDGTSDLGRDISGTVGEGLEEALPLGLSDAFGSASLAGPDDLRAVEWRTEDGRHLVLVVAILEVS